MSLTNEFLEELSALALFDPASTQAGIKVHHDAEPSTAAAVGRLFNKGLVTLADGGYLTPLGQEAARHMDRLTTILTTH